MSLTLGALSLLGSTAWGDTVLLSSANPAPAVTEDRPARGNSMAGVEQRFGAPATRYQAVGQPPITRWDYPGFAVFFEGQRVLHTVSR